MRVKEWLARTIEVVEERRFVPFKWGKNDCVTFVCDVLLAQTGIDYWASFRNTYSTEFGANKVMIKFAGGGLKNLADKLFSTNNFLTIDSTQARMGDLVYFRTCLYGKTPQETLGVYYEDNIIATGIEGLVSLDSNGIIKAWRSF